MDEYRKCVIDFVRAQPLLWDPTHPDYKSQDRRKHVWKQIDGQLPPNSGGNAKSTWDSLVRGFSNALSRKKKRLGSGTGNEREWKFEKDMGFLIPIRSVRNAGGSFQDAGIDSSILFDESTYNVLTQPNSPHVVEDEGEEKCFQSELLEQTRQPPSKRQRFDSVQTNDTNSQIAMMKCHQDGKVQESPRLNFFRSLMATIDTFSEDQFMDFQIEVIQAVKRQKNIGSNSRLEQI